MANMQMMKTPMPEQDPQVRNHNFLEVAQGYTLEQAMNEAQRCIHCKNPACVSGCPVGIPIPDFLAKVAEGDIAAAYEILSNANALPAISGRVCPQENQCEGKCVRGVKGEPVAIGRVERFVADWAAGQGIANVATAPKNGHKVAVIGSGPAGLTCAGELARMGYDVTVFEAFHTAGGVLTYGIPEFRLPKAIVAREIAREHEFGKIVAHAPYTLNACAAKENLRDFARETFADDLKRMEATPGNYYNFHPGSHVGQGIEVGIQKIAEVLNAVLTEDQTTTVLLETMSGKGSEVGSHFQELRAIMDLVEKRDKLGICLDTCHVWDGGYDIVNNLDGVLTEFDRIIGLEKGCDDYITKPFSPKEMVLRVNNIIKRAYKDDNNRIAVDGYELDEEQRKIYADNVEIELTTKEFDLLMMFIKNKGIAFSRDKILENVWDENYFGSDRVVDDTLRRLRKKLPNLNIHTIYGYGYRLG